MAQHKNAVPTRGSRDPLDPAKTTVFMKYHTVAPNRLVDVTLRDLAASGIPERALGTGFPQNDASRSSAA